MHPSTHHAIEIWGTILDYFFINHTLRQGTLARRSSPQEPPPAGSAPFGSIFTASHHIPLEQVAMPGNTAQLKPLLCSDQQIKLIVLASLILVVRIELSCIVRTSPAAKYATASVATPPPSAIKLHHPCKVAALPAAAVRRILCAPGKPSALGPAGLRRWIMIGPRRRRVPIRGIVKRRFPSGKFRGQGGHAHHAIARTRCAADLLSVAD